MATIRTAPPAQERRAPFRADLRDEFRRIFRRPWDDLISVVVNAALVTGLWLLLPAVVKEWLFVPQGPAAFAVVLETWMLADVPATNMIGKDVDTMVPPLDDQVRVQQLLRAKSVALSLLVGVPSAAVAIIIGLVDGALWRGLLVACVLVTLPFGASSIAAWLGILVPYRPVRLRWRWAHRRPWRGTVRWAALVILPFVYVPVISAVLLAPAIVLGFALGERDSDGRLSAGAATLATLVVCALSTAAFVAGPKVGAHLARRRQDRIRLQLDRFIT
jgi:hypothetical protein